MTVDSPIVALLGWLDEHLKNLEADKSNDWSEEVAQARSLLADFYAAAEPLRSPSQGPERNRLTFLPAPPAAIESVGVSMVREARVIEREKVLLNLRRQTQALKEAESIHGRYASRDRSARELKTEVLELLDGLLSKGGE